MQKLKLKIKNKNWVSIVLVCSIIASVIGLICWKMDFIRKNSSAIQAISTIVLICVTVLLGLKNHELEKQRLLQPHSERIGKEFSEWIAKITGLVFDPRDLPDEEKQEYWNVYRIEDPPFYVKQHFESGYPDLYREFEKWKKSANKYNNEIRNFVEEITKRGKEKLKLPDPDKVKRESSYIYYRRIISFIFKKILLPDFPEVKFFTPKGQITFDNLDDSNYEIELRWRDVGMSKADAIKSIEIDRWIKSLETEHKKRIREFYEEFSDLLNCFNKLKEKIIVQIIDKVRYGGIIEGKCDACAK